MQIIIQETESEAFPPCLILVLVENMDYIRKKDA